MTFFEKIIGLVIFAAILFVLNLLAQAILPTKTSSSPDRRLGYGALVPTFINT